MDKIVFFTGAGMSRESGLPVFRGAEGIWESLDVEAVASASAWYCGRRRDCRERRQRVLDFFNPIRRAILTLKPNEGHRLIAEMERDFDVTVITQNGDDFHSRAGSSRVIHLHGEALKNASTANPYRPLPINPESPYIKIGDKAPDGSQLRPYVIFFGENIDANLWNEALRATRGADWFVVVGSSLQVFPAADLLKKLRPECRLVVIDPIDVALPQGSLLPLHHIKAAASDGLRKLRDFLERHG